MRLFASIVAMSALVGVAGWVGTAEAQSRTPPAGSSLADEAPIDETPDQFFALPDDQKNTYRQQDEDNDADDLPPRRRRSR